MNTFIPSSFSADAIAAQAAQFAANQAAIQGAQAAKEQKQANTASIISSTTDALTSILGAFGKKQQSIAPVVVQQQPVIQATPTNYVLWAAGGLAVVAVLGTLVYVVTKD